MALAVAAALLVLPQLCRAAPAGSGHGLGAHPAAPALAVPIGEWRSNGVSICTQPGDQTAPVGLPDGAGGVIVAWEDRRASAQSDIYAIRVGSDGLPIAGWSGNGNAIAAGPGEQVMPRIASAGSGSVFIGWVSDAGGARELFVQRLLPDGRVTYGWPVDGVRVSTAGPVLGFALAADGQGGLIIASLDQLPAGGTQIVLHRIYGSGAAYSGWPAGGITVVGASGSYSYGIPALVGDGMGGGYLAWHLSPMCPPACSSSPGNRFVHVLADATMLILYQNAESADLVLQPDGELGAIVAENRAGTVRIAQFGAIGINGGWRQTSTLPTASGLCAAEGSAVALFLAAWEDSRNGSGDIYGGPVNDAGGFPICRAAGRQFDPRIGSDPFVGDLFACWLDERSGQRNIYCTRMLLNTGVPDANWPLDGYPVCLVAGEPSGLEMVSAGAGSHILFWEDRRSGDRDIYAQRVDETPAPTPVLISLIEAEAGPALARLVWFAPTGAGTAATVQRREPSSDWAEIGQLVADGSGRLILEDRGVIQGRRYGYRLAARGEEEETWLGEVWLDIPSSAGFSLEGAHPNPASGAVELAFTLPRRAEVTLRVFDVAGREVRALAAGTLDAGAHTLRWDAREAGGAPAPAGLYLCELRAGAEHATRRVVLTK